MELFTYCCMSCQNRCSHVFIYPVTPALVYSQNPLGIANLSGRDFGFFYCLCSFDSCTLATQGSPTAYARFITSCAGVNAAIYIRAYAVDGHWAESVHLRMYTNFKPKSPPDKLTQFQRIVLTIHQCRSHLHYIIVATSILIRHHLISVLSHMNHYFPLC